MKVSIVIPNWNGEENLKRNLPKVLETKKISEVIIVDDKSTDQSVKLIEGLFKDVKLIKKNKNSGFGSTVNLGVKNAKGDLVFLLNTDAIPDKNAVMLAQDFFKDKKVFSVSLNSGGNWSWAKFEGGFFWHFESREKTKKVHQTLWASGGSGIFEKDIWDELGGMDEVFDPFYEEDVDLGYRATKRGYKNLWAPFAKVTHNQDVGVISTNFSKEFVSKIAQRNQLLFIWKNITSDALFSEHKKKLLSKVLGNPKYLPTFFSALLKLPKILPKRKKESEDTILTDEEILEKFKADIL